MRKLLLTCPIIIVLLMGCNVKPSEHNNKQPAVVKAVKKVDKDVQSIVDAMNDVSKSDTELMYMQFGGLALYLQNTDKITTVKELNQIFARFQTDYGYKREKYKDYSDAVQGFFEGRGYKKFETITSGKTRGSAISRDQVISDLQVLADAAKASLEKK